MGSFRQSPLRPFAIDLDRSSLSLQPEGPVLTRRLSDLAGLFADASAWQRRVDADDEVVYTVSSSPVPETPTELPQSITTIQPGAIAHEYFFTKGHIHPNPEGEIYLALEGDGGLLMFDGTEYEFLTLSKDRIGYIPPGWAHRSVNVGDTPYSFLAVYPGGAGHDYEWVHEHGFGARIHASDTGLRLSPFSRPTS